VQIGGRKTSAKAKKFGGEADNKFGIKVVQLGGRGGVTRHCDIGCMGGDYLLGGVVVPLVYTWRKFEGNEGHEGK
jgi:hypothetical protein